MLAPIDLLFALLFTFIWGLNFVVVKIGLDSFPPLLFSALRFALAAFPAIFFVRKLDVSWKVILSVGVTLGFVHYSFLYIGISSGMPPGLASIVVQIHVIFTVILSAVALREKPTLAQVMGILVTSIGMFLLILDRFQIVSIFSIFLIICAAASLAVSNIIIRASNIKDSFSFIIWISLIPPLPLLLVSLVFETGQIDALRNMNLTGAGAIIFASLFATVLATALSSMLFQKYSANVVAPFFLLVPIFGMFSSYLILGETLNSIALVSSALVLAGLALVIAGGRVFSWLKMKVAGGGRPW